MKIICLVSLGRIEWAILLGNGPSYGLLKEYLQLALVIAQGLFVRLKNHQDALLNLG